MSAKEIGCDNKSGKWVDRGSGYYEIDKSMWKDCRQAPNPHDKYVCKPDPQNAVQIACSVTKSDVDARRIKVSKQAPPAPPAPPVPKWKRRYSCSEDGKLMENAHGDYSYADVKRSEIFGYDLCQFLPFDNIDDD